MRRLARHLLLMLCALALVSGSMMSFAAAAAAPIGATNPCHEHEEQTDSKPLKHHGPGCLSCCLGACAAIPAVPDRSSVTMIRFANSTIRYWQNDLFLPSRSIAPDPGPPRTSA